MATSVYHLLSGMASAYLATDCQLTSEEGHRRLHSTDSRTCVIRWTYSNFGDRCFAAASPKLWKSFTAGLGQTDVGYEQFKQLFVWAFTSRHIVTIWLNCASLNFSLLTYPRLNSGKCLLRQFTEVNFLITTWLT